MELDKDMKILIIVDLYLLSSIIASAIIHFVLQNYIEIWTAVAFGLIAGTVGIFYSIRLVNAISKRNGKK